jgi:Ankyrin repeats (3 copies)/SAM domain (Sterile alpha motif)
MQSFNLNKIVNGLIILIKMSETFHNACRLGDLEQIKNIVKNDKGYLKDLDSSLGWSGLYRSVASSQYEAVNLLLALESDPNLQNKSGDTPLHQAIESKKKDIAVLLLRYKANPNLQRENGESPLHLSIQSSSKDLIELLMSYGGDLSIPNKITSLSALDLARSKPELLNHIERLMNSPNTCEPQDSPSLDEIKSMIEPEIEDSSKNTLYQWLSKIQMQELFDILISQGYDDFNFLLEQMKSEPLTLQLLEDIGIKKIGHKLILLAALEDEINKYFRKSMPINSSCCSKEKYSPILPLDEWLEKLSLYNTLDNFIENGFVDMDHIMLLMNSSYPITEEILKDIGIKKIGHRQRIIIKLKDEAKVFKKNLSFISTENEEKSIACGLCKII